MQSKIIKVNTRRLPLALHDYGGDGPAVLFLHGFLDNGRSFEDVAIPASSFCRPMCLDWRGHGESDYVVDGSYHQLDHFKDLLNIMNEAPGGKPFDVVVAHSLGGTVALWLASVAPELFPKLLLLDSLGGYAADAKEQVKQFGRLVVHLQSEERSFKSFSSRQSAEERVRHNNPELSAKGAERIVRHYLKRGESGFEVKLDPRLRGPNPFRFSEEVWQEMLSAITGEAKVLVSENGYVLRRPCSTERFQCLQNAEWIDVPKVGHHIHAEVPDIVVRSLREFL